MNGRYGFSMQYPRGLTMDRPPTNGDGAKFYNTEFEVTAYAGHTNIVNEGETSKPITKKISIASRVQSPIKN